MAFAQAVPCDTAAGDTDSDGVCDDVDNCPVAANADQKDSDGDGVGDVCDDDDGDGVLDGLDVCPDSDRSDGVFIEKCDTGAENTVDEQGCSKNDHIAECIANATNHGQFVRCVARLARQWKANGDINGVGKVVRCAARADIPPSEE
jgi:hypothetical protein